MGPELGLSEDVRLLTVRELQELKHTNKEALRSIERRSGSRYDYFRRLYNARLALVEGELKRRSA